MKRILGLFSIAFLLFLVSACSEKFDVAISISNIEAARTSVYLELDVHDPYENIVENSIYVVIYEGKTELNRKTATTAEGVTSVEFTGLAVAKQYEIQVFATYDKKAHKMASTNFTTSEVGGSESNPKLISTIEDFYQMKLDPNAYYRLENDLDFENGSFNNVFFSVTFTGTFDGNGKQIKNVKLDQVNTYLGLFGYNKGTIKNLTVSNAQLISDKSVQYIGIIAGRSSGTIENVTVVDSSISLNYSRTGQVYVGTLVGLSENPSTIKESSANNVSMTLTMLGRSEVSAGLLVGKAQGGQITDSSTTGTINASVKDTSYIGGLIGITENVSTIVTKVSNNQTDVDMTLQMDVTSTLSSDAAMGLYAGGAIGGNFGGQVSSIYATGDIKVSKATNTSSYNKTDDRIVVGGLLGFNNGSMTESLTSTNITVGDTETTNFTSFERLFVGGLVGQQVGKGTTNSLAYNSVIDVDLEANMVASMSVVIGNDLLNHGAFKNVTLTYKTETYQGVVVDVALDVITPTTMTELATNVSDYFTSAYIKTIIEGLNN